MLCFSICMLYLEMQPTACELWATGRKSAADVRNDIVAAGGYAMSGGGRDLLFTSVAVCFNTEREMEDLVITGPWCGPPFTLTI